VPKIAKKRLNLLKLFMEVCRFFFSDIVYKPTSHVGAIKCLQPIIQFLSIGPTAGHVGNKSSYLLHISVRFSFSGKLIVTPFKTIVLRCDNIFIICATKVVMFLPQYKLSATLPFSQISQKIMNGFCSILQSLGARKVRTSRG